MVDNIIAVNSWKHFSNGWFIFAICDVIQRLAISANSESFNNCNLIFAQYLSKWFICKPIKKKSTKNEFISLKQQIPSCVLADRMQFTTFHFRLHCRQLITTYHGIPYNMKRVVIWRNKKKHWIICDITNCELEQRNGREIYNKVEGKKHAHENIWTSIAITETQWFSIIGACIKTI